MGLVKQLLVSLYKKNIQRLTKTFLTLSLSDMASRVHLSSPAEAEKYILRMVSIHSCVTVLCMPRLIVLKWGRWRMGKSLHQSIKRTEWFSFWTILRDTIQPSFTKN